MHHRHDPSGSWPAGKNDCQTPFWNAGSPPNHESRPICCRQPPNQVGERDESFATSAFLYQI